MRVAKERGKQFEIKTIEEQQREIRSEQTRESVLEKLRKLRRPFPPEFGFDRDEANAR